MCAGTCLLERMISINILMITMSLFHWLSETKQKKYNWPTPRGLINSWCPKFPGIFMKPGLILKIALAFLGILVAALFLSACILQISHTKPATKPQAIVDLRIRQTHYDTSQATWRKLAKAQLIRTCIDSVLFLLIVGGGFLGTSWDLMHRVKAFESQNEYVRSFLFALPWTLLLSLSSVVAWDPISLGRSIATVSLVTVALVSLNRRPRMRPIALTVFAIVSILSAIIISHYTIGKKFAKSTPLEKTTSNKVLFEYLGKHSFPEKKVHKMPDTPGAIYYWSPLSDKLVIGEQFLAKAPNNMQLSVLAHEMGHYKAKDNLIRLLTGSLQYIIAPAFMLYLVAPYQFVYDAFGFSTQPIIGAYLISSTVGLIGNQLWEAGKYIMARSFFYRADSFAVDEGYGQGLKYIVKELSKKVITSFTNSSLYEFLYKSQPSLLKRLAHLDKELKKH